MARGNFPKTPAFRVSIHVPPDDVNRRLKLATGAEPAQLNFDLDSVFAETNPSLPRKTMFVNDFQENEKTGVPKMAHPSILQICPSD